MVKKRLVDAAILLGKPDDFDLNSHKICEPRLNVTLSSSDNLAIRKKIMLHDLAGRNIAMPSDINYAYSYLTRVLQKKRIECTFKSTRPFRESYQAFLEEGGVFFSFEKSQSLETLINAACVPFDNAERISPPIHIVYQKKSTLNPLPIIISYIKDLTR